MLNKSGQRVFSVVAAAAIFGVPVANVVSDLSGISGLGAFIACGFVGMLAAFRPDAALLVGPAQRNGNSGVSAKGA